MGAAYYVSALIGLKAALVHGIVTPIWPPTGIALVALLLLGEDVWPGVALAALVVNLPITPNPLAALGIAVGNTAAPLLACYLLRRHGFRPQLDRLKDAVGLVFFGMVAMAVSASFGTATLLFAGTIGRGGVIGTWSVWWAGDVMGVLIVAPVLLSLLQAPPVDGRAGGRTEGLLLAVALIAMAGFVFASPFTLRFLVFPLLVWAAVRFGQRGASAATLVVCAVAVWSAAPSFATMPLAEAMLTLQAFNVAAALMSLVLAAVIAERRQAAQALARAADELEVRVADRTAALRAANEQLSLEVAERQRAEDRANRRERQLAQAQQIASVGSWEWDLETNKVTWSDEMYRIHGHAPQSFPVTYERAMEQVVAEDRPNIAARLHAGLAHRPVEREPNEYRIVRPDGQERTLSGKGSIVLSEEGRPVRMIGTVQDVTAQHQSEAALREAEEEFRTLFESAATGRAQCDPQGGRFLRINAALGELLGYSAGELAGMTLAGIVHPEDRGGFVELVDRLLTGRISSFSSVTRLCRSDGSSVWVHGTVSITRDAAGVPRFAQAVLQDLTEQRRAEEHFSQLFNLSVDLMAVGTLDGRLLRVNPSFRQLLGSSEEEILGRPFVEFIHPDDRSDAHAELDALAAGRTLAQREFRMLCRDGGHRWALFSAKPVPEHGLMFAVGIDITERKLADALLRESEERYRVLVEHAPEAIVVLDLEAGHFVEANREAERLFGMPREQLYGLGPADVSPELQPDGRSSQQAAAEQIQRALAGASPQFEWLLRDTGGRQVLCDVRLLHLPAVGRSLVRGSLIDITERRRAEAALKEAEERDRAHRQQQAYTQQLQELAEMSLAVNAALSSPDALSALTEAARRIIGAHQAAASLMVDQDWANAIHATSLSDKYAAWRGTNQAPDDAGPSSLVRDTNRSMRLTQAELESHPDWRGFGASSGRPPLRGWLAAPLVGPDGANLGLVQLSDRHEGDFTEQDEAILMQITQIGSVAIANAQLLEREQRVAQTLQRSLLPERLPAIAGVATAARYLPAGAGLEVGGDWYDVFALPGGAVGLAIGDIVGRGLRAAATMGQLRTALRAYALEGGSPARVVERLSSLAQTLGEAEMSTLVYAVCQPEAGVLTFVCAGHPPPLVVGPDGRTCYIEGGRWTPLGVSSQPPKEAVVALESGSVVLLYTDGLVERPGAHIDEGLGRLARAANEAYGNDLEAICDAVVDAMIAGEGVRDDVALLALTTAPQSRERYVCTLPAEPQHLATLRRGLSQWLAGAGAAQDEIYDLVLAAGEAAANAMEHAYGPGDGTLEVTATVTAGEIELRVRDSGTWRSRIGDAGGRGFILMQGLAESVEVTTTSRGTTVSLRRRLGRPVGLPAAEITLPEPPPPGVGSASERVRIAEVTEEIDLSSADRIAAKLRAAVPNDSVGLVVDLSGLVYMDSSGVRMLFDLSRRLRRRRQELRVVVPGGSPIRRVLELAQVDTVVPVSETVDEGVASILLPRSYGPG